MLSHIHQKVEEVRISRNRRIFSSTCRLVFLLREWRLWLLQVCYPNRNTVLPKKSRIGHLHLLDEFRYRRCPRISAWRVGSFEDKTGRLDPAMYRKWCAWENAT